MATAVLDRPRVLHSAKDYTAAVEEIHRLLDLNPGKGSPELDALELLSVLVEDYETRNIPEPPPGKPQSIVEFMLEQKGLSRSDLVHPLGGKSRVSEFFAGKRPLSTNQIKALRDLLGIPADLLLEAAEEPKPRRTAQVVSLQFHGDKAVARSAFSGADDARGKQRVAKGNPRHIAVSAKTRHGVKKGFKAAARKK